MLKKIKLLVESPCIIFAAGMILLVSSAAEILRDIEDFSLGAHHGVFAWAVMQVLSSLPDMIEGFKKVTVGHE